MANEYSETVLRATPDPRVGGASYRAGGPALVKWEDPTIVGWGLSGSLRKGLYQRLGGLTHPEHSPLSAGESRYRAHLLSFQKPRCPSECSSGPLMSGKGSGSLTVEPSKTFKRAQTGCKIRFPPVEEVRREENTLL